jgi:hypothetical protein
MCSTPDYIVNVKGCRALGSEASGAECSLLNSGGAVFVDAGLKGCNCGLFGECYGRQRRCKLVQAYDSVVTKCCAGTISDADRRLCGKDACPGSVRCNRVLGSVCKGNLLFTDRVCNDFCRSNPSFCTNNMRVACVGDKLKTDECKFWGTKSPELYRQNMLAYCKDMSNPFCQEYAKTHTGFDSAVAAFCTEHPGDPFCACSTTALNRIPDDNEQIKVLKAKPQCYLKDCANSGYKFISQRTNTGGCPELCMQNISAAGTGNIITGNTTTQNCGGVQVKDTPSDSPSSPSSPSSSSSSSSLLTLLLYIVMIAIIIAGTYRMAKKILSRPQSASG